MVELDRNWTGGAEFQVARGIPAKLREFSRSLVANRPAQRASACKRNALPGEQQLVVSGPGAKVHFAAPDSNMRRSEEMTYSHCGISRSASFLDKTGRSNFSLNRHLPSGCQPAPTAPLLWTTESQPERALRLRDRYDRDASCPACQLATTATGARNAATINRVSHGRRRPHDAAEVVDRIEAPSQ